MLRRDLIRWLSVAGIGAMAPMGARATASAAMSLPKGLHGVIVRPHRANGLGVLLQPTIAAIDPYMRRVADDLAGRGYTVVIWDPYDGEAAPAGTMAQLTRSKRIRDSDAMAALRAVTDYMIDGLRLRSIATIGWCLGGRYVLMQAGLDKRIAAAIAYNPTIYSVAPVMIRGAPLSRGDFPGQTIDEFACTATISCPVHVFRPGHDLAQPAEYMRLEQVLFARSAPSGISYFPDAEHGFSYQLASPADRAAAAIAWPVTLALLESVHAQSGA